MSETKSLVEEYEKIITASNYQSEQENPEFGDVAYCSFVQLMKQRREIAKRYLSTNSTSERKQYFDLFEHFNLKIKQILGL